MKYNEIVKKENEVLNHKGAKVHSGDSLVSKAIGKTILRADEISKLLSCYA